MINVRELKKEYSDGDNSTFALNDISFSIGKGEFVSIMGPSGSGKSTLLHILSFLDRPTSGTYTFDGRNIYDLDDKGLAHFRNKEMGFVFQSFNLLARLTVYENIEIPLLFSDIPKSKRNKLIVDAVSAVGLDEKLYVEAGKLSGGQKQRVAIARALVNNPNVIFADEPTGNLDSESGLQIMNILKDLHEKGRTIVLVTHETVTARFADRIIWIKDGSIQGDIKIPSHNTVTKLK